MTKYLVIALGKTKNVVVGEFEVLQEAETYVDSLNLNYIIAEAQYDENGKLIPAEWLGEFEDDNDDVSSTFLQNQFKKTFYPELNDDRMIDLNDEELE